MKPLASIQLGPLFNMILERLAGMLSKGETGKAAYCTHPASAAFLLATQSVKSIELLKAR